MDNDISDKNKRGWVIAFITITFGWYIFSFLDIVIVNNVTDFSVNFTIPDLSVVVSNFLSAIVCFYLMVRLNLLYRKRKSIINLIMAAYFLVTAVPAVSNGMISFMQFNSEPLMIFFELSAFF